LKKINKIKLIAPISVIYKIGKNEVRWRIPPYSLALIAALTPAEIEVEIVDENVDVDKFDDNPDLVGIT
jgi:hypothetical protein